MKLNKIMLATVVTLGLSSMVAQAANQGQGAVKFTGAIIDAPCSISPESVDQTVELGQVSNSLLKKGGKSTPKAFTIDLEHCEVENGKNNVSVTFTGIESATQKGMLSISGQASGASVAITDAGGKIVELGKSSPLTGVNEGNTALRFAAYLQGDGASSTVVPGDFTAVADFTLAYQ
ncbi:Fimbria A protein precursor [Serratia entomophila]|uniref:Fimbrial protein n=1 Tax=Serratia entomophila TaxID=42906 RepID=A0ABY5CUT4_9GAMM|nr:fimbrial protein [Serratia entomophila]UIW18840.1 fimbrial protein [Serratia entomophila]USV01500.1 fimbrial protein [Serratia entomophila]CAI0775811.1 Fimbria A protein precursor [Serratia entomophila]CAI0775840.1 Fimbria A protein precursor [Serratia entomophila]CAI0799123.1 Fimbria A protein precursor [Serratia entomophila]